jgi:hypothetical protein
MIVHLSDLSWLDSCKGLTALFLFWMVWWRWSERKTIRFERWVWAILLPLQLMVGGFVYHYQVQKYSNSEGGDASALLLNASKLHELSKSSPKDYWSLIVKGKPYSQLGETTTIGMKIWRKTNHYGFPNEKQLMVRLTSCLLWLSGKSYTLVFFSFAFIAWLGLYLLSSLLRHTMPRASFLVFWLALLASPSVMIWTSLPGKEGLLLLSAAMFLWGIYLLQNKNWMAILYLFVAIILMIEFRVFLFLCAIPAFFFALFAQFFSRLSAKTSFVLSLVLPIVLICLVQIWAWQYQPSVIRSDFESQEAYERENGQSYARQVQQPGVNILEKLKFKRLDLEVEAKQKHAATQIDLPKIDGSVYGLIQGMPVFIWNGVVGTNWFKLNYRYWIWGFERGLFALALLFLCFRFINSEQPEPILATLLLWAICIGCFLGMLMPVLGNISRYYAVVHLPVILFYLGSRYSSKAVEKRYPTSCH